MNGEMETLRQEFPDTWRWIRIARRIDGWLSDKEANALFELTRDRAPQRDAVVVELGSWVGKSSILLAAGMRHKQNPRLFCVDPFGLDENPAFQEQHYAPLISKMRRSLEEAFHRNIRRCGFSGMVCAQKGYSFEVVRSWTKPIDILFIDASHGYEAVHRDVLEWTPFLKVGGTVALHDVSPTWPGPSQVMAEDLQPPYFEDLEQADSLTWAVKRTAGPFLGAERRTRIVIPKSDFDRRQQEIAQLSVNLKYLADQRERILADLAASEAAGREARAQIDGLEREARARIDGLMAAAQEARTRIDALTSELRDTAYQLAEARHTVAELRSSWSWRLSLPLRLVLDGVRDRGYLDLASRRKTPDGETRKPPQSESLKNSRARAKR
jgi:predicted O-methyltransferase YrrM/predicted DCC family thiol-disulfide oxidoreductase YuxK